MTFEQLECFIAVVRYDTYFDAAETLNITQSALSKQIIRLEKELGVRLLERRHRTTELTEAGKAFYEEAQIIRDQYRRMLVRVHSFSEKAGNELHIGALPIMSQYHLTGPMRSFAAHRPEISLTVTEAEEEEMIRGLDEGSLDILIARKHLADKKSQVFFPLREDRLMAVLPCSHLLSGKEHIDIRELADERFILMNSYTSIYKVCMELFRKAGIKPEIIRTARMESILSDVEVGEGVSLFAEGNYQLFHSEGVTAVPVEETPELTIGMIIDKGRKQDAAVMDFVSFMKKACS